MNCVYCGPGPVFDCVCPTCQRERGLDTLPYEQWPLGVRVIIEARREAVRLSRANQVLSGQRIANGATFRY